MMAHTHTVNASAQGNHAIAWLGDDGTLDTVITVYCESCDESADYRFNFAMTAYDDDPAIDDACDECDYAEFATEAMADALDMFEDDHDCSHS